MESGRSAVYCYDDAQLQQHLATLGSASRGIQRFKVQLLASAAVAQPHWSLTRHGAGSRRCLPCSAGRTAAHGPAASAVPNRAVRLQGLGEMMPEQLWQTTLDPSRRTLRRLTLQDAAQAAHLFTLLMGSQVRVPVALRSPGAAAQPGQ